MLLLIDNYDSFTYNLVQAFAVLGETPLVIRNDEETIEEITALNPTRIVISPGPGTPADSGISRDVISIFGLTGTPVLGICLGHQCIAQQFGAHIIQSKSPMHGKTSEVNHDGASLFENIPSPFLAMRYHSLIVDSATFPSDLETTATTADGTIMALKHRRLPIYGVQFHPESILTPDGTKLLANFLLITGHV